MCPQAVCAAISQYVSTALQMMQHGGSLHAAHAQQTEVFPCWKSDLHSSSLSVAGSEDSCSPSSPISPPHNEVPILTTLVAEA